MDLEEKAKALLGEELVDILREQDITIATLEQDDDKVTVGLKLKTSFGENVCFSVQYDSNITFAKSFEKYANKLVPDKNDKHAKTVKEILRETANELLVPESLSRQLADLTKAIREQLVAATDLAEEQRFKEMDSIINTVMELRAKAELLKEQVQTEPISEVDVAALRMVKPPRKSVQNMLDAEVAQTTKFEKLLSEEMGEKSAYEMRNSGNAWREDESKTVPIIEIQKRVFPKKRIDLKGGAFELRTDVVEFRRQIKENKSIPLGTFINHDTSLEIQFSGQSIGEITAKAIPDVKVGMPVEARLSTLFQMREIIENAICFDSQISEYHYKTSKNKSPHTLFIHKLYGVTSYDNDLFLVNLSVEEMYKKVVDNEMSGTHNKLYSLRDISLRGIKITPVELSGLKARASLPIADKVTPSGVTNISIPQLYQIVKINDKNFFEKSIAVGRTERLEEINMHKAYDKAVKEFNEFQANNPKKPNGGGDGEGGDAMEQPSSSSEADNKANVSPNKGEPVTEPLDSHKEDNLSNGLNESGDTTITNNAQTPNILNSAENTYSGKENKTMGNLEIYRKDDRTLQKLLDDYEQSEKEVKENSLDEISTEEDYKQLPEADQQTLTEYNTNRKLLVEAKMALDFVATSTIFTPNGNEPCVQMLMDSKTEYAHAVATLTGGFDKRMGKILETVDNSKSFDRSYANAPLTDKTIAGIIKDEMKGGILEKTTVGDLVKVISDTREIRDTLRIKDDRIVDDTEEVLIHDKGRLNAFEFIDSDEKERENIKFVDAMESEVVESNDGYALNTSKQTAGNEKAIGEKVNAKNEVVHNEAPKATTTDASKVGGNVKLEEVNDKGTEDKHAAASRKNDDRDDR